MGFKIRAASAADMSAVADVHSVCFPNNFSTRLGRKLLTNYYMEFYNEAPHLFLVCENDDGEMCGFVMGYVLGYTNAVSGFMKKNRFKMGMKVLGLLLCFDKLAWRRVKNTFSRKKKDGSDTPVIDKTGEGDLLSICVTDDMKGTGAAVEMVNRYNDVLREHGHKVCYLTCETSNPRGLAFYRKLGYSAAEETQEKICFRKDLV